MPIADPTTSGRPAAMPRTGKVNGSMPAAIMQAFYQLLLYITQTLGSVSSFGLRIRFLAAPISDMAKLSANKISYRPGKFIP
jgi:hypothetical protein